MAEITTTIDRSANLTVNIVRGEVTVPGTVDFLAEYSKTEPTKCILWDFTEALLEHLTAHDVRAIAQEVRRYAHLRPGGKTAMVVSSQFGYGMGRVIDQTQSATDSPVEFRTFRDRAAALAWLAKE